MSGLRDWVIKTKGEFVKLLIEGVCFFTICQAQSTGSHPAKENPFPSQAELQTAATE